MDISQISELATAIMESWATASPANHQQQQQQILPDVQTDQHKFVIKQEQYEFPGGTTPLHGYLNPHQGGHLAPQDREQVPMDELLDPLESFSFWDGENFYMGATDSMAVDGCMMPTLPEYVDDEMTRDDDEEMLLKDPENLLRNPTLAELNSCEFDFVNNSSNHSFFAAEDSSYQLDMGLSKSFPAIDNHLDLAGLSKSFPAVALESHFVASPVGSVPNNNSCLSYVPNIDIKQNVQPSLSSSCPSMLVPHGQFHGQFLDKYPLCPQNSPASDSYFGTTSGGKIVDHQVSVGSPSHSHVSPSSPLRVAQSNRFQQDSGLLSSSAPPDASYFRTKIKSEPLSSSPSGSGGPRSITERSLSGFSSLSLSNDDESGSFFDDEDEEDDFSSDEDVYQYESDDPLPSDKSTPRKHRYFWQYNLQSRGAKSQHILPRGGQCPPSDPHAPTDPFDPVFHEECALPVKHSGKARRGDGNDLTPDPRKLHSIGVELRGLNRMIYCTEGGAKPLSRKEKNKLASRVCRLKKKAQHEANKIKLYGLQQEHKKLLSILVDTRELLKYKIENLHDKKVSNCSKKLETFLAANAPYKVAGNTATFVNEVLEKVSKGEPDGGLGRL